MTDEKVKVVYECHNPACTLGSRKDPGRFTDGITPEALNVLTGDPVEQIEAEGKYGEGFCPVCGEQGTPVEADEEAGDPGVHDFSSGDRTDPYQHVHDAVVGELTDAVNERLADENDESVTKDNHKEVLAGALSTAQAEVEARVEKLQHDEREATAAGAALVTDHDDDGGDA